MPAADATLPRVNEPPYRGRPPEAPAAPPALTLPWRDVSASSDAVVGLQLTGLSLTAVGAAAALHPGLAALTAAALAFAGTRHLRRRRAGASLALAVDAGRLTAHLGATPVCELPVSDVRDVQLERREHQAVTFHQEVGSPMLTARVSAPTEVVRIVIVRADGGPVRLSESYGSYTEGTAAFARVRFFLRQHGWLPPDERAAR